MKSFSMDSFVDIYGGTSSGSSSLAIINDNVFEANESFILTVESSSLGSRVLVQPDCMTVVTIVDDDRELLYYIVTMHIYRGVHMYCRSLENIL